MFILSHMQGKHVKFVVLPRTSISVAINIAVYLNFTLGLRSPLPCYYVYTHNLDRREHKLGAVMTCSAN